MPLHYKDSCVGFVRLWMPLADFPVHLRQGLATWTTTATVESVAKALIAAKFVDRGALNFVEQVCNWGNYPGIAGRIKRDNLPGAIAEALRSAHALTAENKIVEALEALLVLKGLAVSFASKHLRFLDPNRHAVLDSIISQRLGYPMTKEGYAEFVDDCSTIAKRLTDERIPYCGTNLETRWRVADVELAIYHCLRNN